MGNRVERNWCQVFFANKWLENQKKSVLLAEQKQEEVNKIGRKDVVNLTKKMSSSKLLQRLILSTTIPNTSFTSFTAQLRILHFFPLSFFPRKFTFNVEIPSL